MKYGFFDDEAREYVITTPDTPLPWINYLGSENFFSLISNTGGGYHFFQDAKLRRLTRYRYNGVPGDAGGRMYYISDGETTWSPTFAPAKVALDSYRCRHGMGYTIFESSKNGLHADLRCFVPLGKACEINQLTLRNETSSIKEIQLFSAVEWCLWNAVDDASNFQRNYNTGEVEVEQSILYHKTEYRERRNHYAFFSVNAPIAGFDSDRNVFLGRFNGYEKPQVVTAGKSQNSIAHGWAPMASHQLSVVLAPNQEVSYHFLLGYVELPNDEKWQAPNVINKAPAKELALAFETEKQVEDAFSELQRYWEELLSRFHIASGSSKLDRMVNTWHQYQCMVTFNMSRSASYYESGMGRGMGFRDSCQDLLGFVHLIPERARQRILDIAAIQMEDGSCWHQYQPLTKQGNADAGIGFNDDPLWLIACTYAYISETGDDSILSEPVAFNTTPGTEVSLFVHLRCSISYTLSHLGPHGLPLIGRADWNDCLNLNCFSSVPGESFQTCANFESGVAESVFIAGMFVLYGQQYAELCDRFGNALEATQVRQSVEVMHKNVLDHGWDGEWFLRAYDAFGHKVGSCECEEGQIYIEPQGMCAMAGIGLEEGYVQKALHSAKEHLTTDFGSCLLAPCYSIYHEELGEVSSYPPGYKENGGIFCHNNPWLSIAETVAGNSEEAFAIYRRTCPAWVEEISDIHKTEPYVYSQMIAGKEAASHGEAKNSWLTGTAAWTFVNVSQYLLGIQPTLAGLMVRPCLPEIFSEITIHRLYRGVRYSITLQRTGASTMVVDGMQCKESVIPHPKQKETCNVLVTF